jgi:excisionase family DNA binding protein
MTDTDYLTEREVAEMLRVPVETLRYWRWQGTAPKSFKVGRRTLYARDDVEAFVAQARAVER